MDTRDPSTAPSRVQPGSGSASGGAESLETPPRGAGRDRLAVFGAALWWGSLTAVGAWVVPLLFANLPSSALAGQTAARLFAAQTWVALACGLLLLMTQPRHRIDAGRGLVALWVAAGMLLALVSEHAVAPRILARQDLALWHSVGTLMLVGQWACAGMALWRLSAPRPISPADPS